MQKPKSNELKVITVLHAWKSELAGYIVCSCNMLVHASGQTHLSCSCFGSIAYLLLLSTMANTTAMNRINTTVARDPPTIAALLSDVSPSEPPLSQSGS